MQYEGAPLSTTKVNDSKNNILSNGYGYLDDINISYNDSQWLKTVGISNSLIPESATSSKANTDVSLQVNEKLSNQLVFMAGYKTDVGFVASASVNQASIFGSGKSLDFDATYEKKGNKAISLSYGEPDPLERSLTRNYHLSYSIEKGGGKKESKALEYEQKVHQSDIQLKFQ